MRSRFPVLLGTAILLGTPAVAQEEEGTVPGQPVMPGTYQGSMEMQRQSDEQDQKLRDQLQQESQQRDEQWQQTLQQQQQQRSYGGGEPARTYAPPSSRGSPQRGASSGAAPALNPLAAAFQRGDYATVVKILRPKALAGNPSAQHNLGFMYEKGYGVPRNPAIAASWYQKSANQGYPAGQLALGRLYFEGDGLRRDLVEAYKWMYLAGRGTSKALQYLKVIGNMLTYDQMSVAMQRAQLWTPAHH